jgi:PAS domain S-box-containing protein
MRSFRGRIRTSDVLVVAIAAIAATVSTITLANADEQMTRGTHAERLLERIDESENELYDAAFAVVEGEADAAQVRNEAALHARQIAEIQTLDPELRTLLAGIAPADRRFRRHVQVELSLLAAKSTRLGEYHRRYVEPAHEATESVVTEAGALVEERNQALRHRFSVTSIFAALLAILCTAIGILLLSRTRRARARAEDVQLAAENQRLRDQTAVAELVVQVARAADSTESVERLLERTLGLFCLHAGWPIGHLWSRTEDGGLVPSGIWHLEEPGRYRTFRKATAALASAGEGTLPDRAAATRTPVWTDEISSDSRARASAARADGLKTALALPIVADGEVVAVLELFTDRPLPKDRALVDVAKALAVQLRDFVERKALDVDRRRLAAIVASSADGILATDAEGRVTSWNPAAEELSGYPVYEMLGENVRKLFPDETQSDLDGLAAVLASGEPVRNYETKIQRRSGQRFDTSVTISPLERGQGYAITFRDVTELRDAQERYRTLVEQLPLAVYVDEPSEVNSACWNTVYASPQIEDLLGLTPEEFRARTYVDLVHPDDAERVIASHELAFQTRSHLDEEYRLVRQDGSTVWVRDAMSFIGDENGGVAYSQGYLLDVSARKANEEEFDRLLARERDQNEELRELDRLKDEFVALVSHELRTPLTSIRGYLELVLDDTSGGLTDEQRQFLKVVERNSDRLQRLVGDLLFVAQVDAGRLSLELDHLDAVEVGAEAVEAARPSADQKGLALRLVGDTHAGLIGDRARLAQLLDNLVSNAIKFTPSDGHVDVSVRSGDGNVTIEVSDSGMGISGVEQERLFQRFYRTHSATSQAIPGTGLGLAISKAIVDAHEGTIEFESTEGKGTTFRITIPAHVNQMEEAA